VGLSQQGAQDRQEIVMTGWCDGDDHRFEAFATSDRRLLAIEDGELAWSSPVWVAPG
jgi:hypothetical protein